MNILENAKQQGSFNNWLTNLPEEDLQYLSEVTDQVSNGTLEDADAFEQLLALAMHFSGKTAMTEDEVQDAFQSLSIFLAIELNVRKGHAEKDGIYSMVPGEDTARMKLTDKGIESVEKMMAKN